MLKRISTALVLIWLVAAPVLAQQPPAGGQAGFEPAGDVPVTEQLPAAPLVITAYAFVWIALMLYLWSIWRRLGKVEGDIRALEQRQRGGAR